MGWYFPWYLRVPDEIISSFKNKIDGLFDKDKIKKLDNKSYPFYVVLLTSSIDSFLSEFMEKYTIAIHEMSGETCLLFAPYHYKNLPIEIENYWKKNLSDQDYKELVSTDPYPDLSFGVAKILKIERQRLPGLFITTTLDSKDGIYFKVPKWDDDNLYALFEYLFDELDKIADNNDEERSKKLQNISEHANWKIGKLYVKNNWFDAIKSEKTQTLLTGLLTKASPS